MLKYIAAFMFAVWASTTYGSELRTPVILPSLLVKVVDLTDAEELPVPTLADCKVCKKGTCGKSAPAAAPSCKCAPGKCHCNACAKHKGHPVRRLACKMVHHRRLFHRHCCR